MLKVFLARSLTKIKLAAEKKREVKQQAEQLRSVIVQNEQNQTNYLIAQLFNLNLTMKPLTHRHSNNLTVLNN